MRVDASEHVPGIAGPKLVIRGPSESCEHMAENLDAWKRMSPSNLSVPGRQSREKLRLQSDRRPHRELLSFRAHQKFALTHCAGEAVVFHVP